MAKTTDIKIAAIILPNLKQNMLRKSGIFGANKATNPVNIAKTIAHVCNSPGGVGGKQATMVEMPEKTRLKIRTDSLLSR